MKVIVDQTLGLDSLGAARRQGNNLAQSVKRAPPVALKQTDLSQVQ
jgi:hypothetical protein